MAKMRPYDNSGDGRSRHSASALADETSDLRRFARFPSFLAKSDL